jgi:allophanate hydrolase
MRPLEGQTVTDIALTIPSLTAAYAAGTPVASVIAQIYARIAELADPAIFITLIPQEQVLAAAKALGPYDPTRPLWGVPFAVKDNIDVAGCPTTAACPAFAYMADTDAFVVARIRAAGGLCIGKTNLDQFATGLVGVRSPYGVPLNALDPAIVPGGSSAGSAVAVAQGIVTLALGTDTAGSGRVPAALNNIVGLKPSLGALSASGVVPACRSIETVSIFGLTVQDAWSAYQVVCAYDADDPYARSFKAPELTSAPPVLKIGIPSPQSIKFFGDTVQSASFDAAVSLLRASGAMIVDVDFAPLYAVAAMLYDGAWVAERYTVIEALLKADAEAILPVTRKIISKAESLSAADAFRGMYRFQELARHAEVALAGLDILCVPTIPTFYSLKDLQEDPITPNSNFGTYTNFVNLLNMCGLAVPTPPRSDGRPGSVTLLAKAGQDHLLASVALVLEAAGRRTMGATPWPVVQHPVQGGAPTDTITVAVCGAHMSGLPLNSELVSRGAVFAQVARTSADYRFYALPGEPPQRPGLLRIAPGQGEEIALELWAVPLTQFGSFMQTVPSPLGIGTVQLSDGQKVFGFLCESQATQNAQDITDLADWRLFLQRSASDRTSA